MSVLISQDGLSFYGQNEAMVSKQFDQRLNPIEILREIELCFESEEKLNQKFKNIRVIYDHEIFTLVPTPIFNPDHAVDYLKFNSRILKTDFISYDSLVDEDICVVFVPYANINNYFLDKYGSFDFFHIASIRIQERRKNRHISMGVHLEASHFDCVIDDSGKFIYYNHFIHQSPEDVAYYLLFAAQELNLDLEKFNVSLTGSGLDIQPTVKLLSRYIRNVDTAKLKVV